MLSKIKKKPKIFADLLYNKEDKENNSQKVESVVQELLNNNEVIHSTQFVVDRLQNNGSKTITAAMVW